jgi:hypothetical protein
MGSSGTELIGRQRRQDESEAEFKKKEERRKVASAEIKKSLMKTETISKLQGPALKSYLNVQRAAASELKQQMEYSNFDEADNGKSLELEEISRRHEKEAIEANLLQDEAVRAESDAKARIQREEELRLAKLQADADSKLSFHFRFKQNYKSLVL